MAAIYALTICLVLYAIGDIVSVKTKGLLSLVFVLCVVMLIGFWCGLLASRPWARSVPVCWSSVSAPL